MKPTFRDGDGLEIQPYEHLDDMRRGDVVIFAHPDESYDVVHRVIRVNNGYAETRGDNNSYIDPYRVEANAILGRVVKRRRGRRQASVLNGRLGLAIHCSYRCGNTIKVSLARLIRPIYSRLAGSGWFYGWHRFFITFSSVAFRRPGGTEHQLVWRNRCIAIRRAGEDSWQVRFPFRLFIDFSPFDEPDIEDTS